MILTEQNPFVVRTELEFCLCLIVAEIIICLVYEESSRVL